MRVQAIGKKLMAGACAVALSLVSLGGLSGCSQVQEALGVVSNSDPSVALSSTLPSGSTITEGTLTVGVNGNNSPYGGKSNTDGSVIGLDVDVASTLADSLGCKVNIIDVSTNGKKALAEGSIDILMGASMTGSDDTISYSSAYINDGVSLFCKITDMPDSVAVDLTKEQVIVQASTTAAVEMQDALGASSILTASTMQEAFESLENGNAKYLAANAVIGDYYARNYSDIMRIDFLSVNDVSPVYVACNASNTELASAVNNAMSSITTDGTLKVVASKWLGDQGSTVLPGAVDVEDLPKTFTATGKESKKSEKSADSSDESSANAEDSEEEADTAE